MDAGRRTIKSTTFGRTDIAPTILGLGTGGFSRIGIKGGTDTAERVVRTALDAGINYIDSSENYGTEEAIGNGLTAYPRESYYICTKYSPHRDDRIATAAQLEAGLTRVSNACVSSTSTCTWRTALHRIYIRKCATAKFRFSRS